jgi:membrane protein implicated in regulation of membrane protease activity
MDKPRRVPVSRAGAVLAGALVIGLVALFLPTGRTVQMIGFIVVLIVALVLIAEYLPRSMSARSMSAFRLRNGPDYMTKARRTREPVADDGEDVYGEPPEPVRRPGRGA